MVGTLAGLYVCLIKRHQPTLISTHAAHLCDSSACHHPVRESNGRGIMGQVMGRAVDITAWRGTGVKCKCDLCLGDSDDLVRGPWQKQDWLGVTTVMVYTGWLTSQSLIAAAPTAFLWLVCTADTGALANEHQSACPSTSNEDMWQQYHIITAPGTWVRTVEARAVWERWK